MSQSVATLAALALDNNIGLHEVGFALLEQQLKADHQKLKLPEL